MLNWRSRRILLRYLCCFLIAFLFPMLLLCSYFLHSLNDLLTRQTLEMKSAAFDEELIRTFGLLDNIYNTAYQMAANDAFGRYRLINPVQYGKDIIGELSACRKICEAADAVYLYSDLLDYVYSDTSTYSNKRFIHNLEQAGLSQEDFNRVLCRTDMPNGYAVYTSQSIWLFFHFPTHAFSSDLYLLFQLNPGLIGPQNSSGHSHKDSGYGIYKDGATLFLYGDGKTASFDGTIKTLLSAASPDASPLFSTFSDNNQIYDLFIARYPAIDFYYYSVSPQDAIVSFVTQNQGLTYLVIFSVFFCGNLLCFYFAYASYRPIEQLNTKARDILRLLQKGDVIPTASNELELVQTALYSLQTSLNAFTEAGGVNNRAIRQFLIGSLLRGQATDPNAISAGLQQLGICADADFVLAGILYLSESSAPGDGIATQGHLSWLESFSQDSVNIYAILGLTPNQIDLLIILDEEDILLYEDLFTKLLLLFSRQFHLMATMAFGSVYPELNMVSVSYLQAAQKVAGRRLQDDGKILYHTEEEIDNRFYRQIRGHFPHFHSAVQECNPQEAALLLSGLEQALLESDLRINEVQFMLSNILEVLASSFYDYNFEIGSNFCTRCQIQEIEKVTTPEGLHSFMAHLSENMLHVMHQELEKRELYRCRPQDSLPLAERIKDYVDKNLRDQQLSITGMSLEFSVSASYLCRIFKEKNKLTILEYINNGRINLAKQYLSQTDLTVETIVQKIGFVNTSSFIRKFSGVVGMTPGKYRAQSSSGSMPANSPGRLP